MIQPESERLALVKACVADPTKRVELDDLIAAELRVLLPQLTDERFSPNQSPIDAQTVGQRLQAYNELFAFTAATATLLGRWGDTRSVGQLTSLVSQIANSSEAAGGYEAWIGLRWYPVSLVHYCAGIAALAGDNYDAFAALFRARTLGRYSEESDRIAFLRANSALADAGAVFKLLPGLETKKVPRSEYMFTTVNALLDRVMFLGTLYEPLFDRFEALNALLHAEKNVSSRAWGPPGRFIWKAAYGGDVLTQMVTEADALRTDWGPLRAGLFAGSPDKFKELVAAYRSLFASMRW
jgi:hypothetical protein